MVGLKVRGVVACTSDCLGEGLTFSSSVGFDIEHRLTGLLDGVDEVLGSIEAARVPQLIVFNKTDVAWPEWVEQLLGRYPGSVAISAYSGDGVAELLEAISDRVRALTNVVELFIPYGRGDLLAAVHREGEVLVEGHEDNGTRVRARLDIAGAGRFREFVVQPEG